jgi:hypothetical protein
MLCILSLRFLIYFAKSDLTKLDLFHSPSFLDLVGLLIPVVLFVSTNLACWHSLVVFGAQYKHPIYMQMKLSSEYQL